MDFPVVDWEAIPLDTYKALFSEVKERFDVATDEVVSCTDKSIRCLLAFISYFFGVSVFLLSNHYEISQICYLTLMGVSIYNGYLGYRIIRLRPSHTIGLLPENVLSKDYNLDSGFTDEEKEKLFYYKAIGNYSQKISEGTVDNSKRAKKYDTFFGLTLLLVVIIALFVFYTISSHPVSAKT